ncbi:hypothetical protein C8A05DRAFT_48132 [Staphylotrichum tortipilum]|uniref:Uncharacterized protein n=1 Tax=Staphylotrichum tortipilum TaxID=2831512 RepID=A0AAN6MB30_9PEZI|nr:hypothetical protein C8A05DRAFT_48132 [Staphylotrichum longicolle]
MMPENTRSSDACVINAFKFLDKARTDGDNILSRLAYIQLAQVFESLKQIIASDRLNGQLSVRRPGYGNASVAADIFIEAQEHIDTSRDEVKQVSLHARRWRTLAGPSPIVTARPVTPIFIIIYSEVAEGLACVLFVILLTALY